MIPIISYSDYYLPENPCSIRDFVDLLSIDFINNWGKTFFGSEISKGDFASILLNTTKITHVGIEDRNNEVNLFIKLFEKYFKNNKKDDIDFIIYTRGDSVVNDINIPYYLQKYFCIKDSQVFCIEQECSGTLLALKLAKNLLQDDETKKILILSRNYFPSNEKRIMGLFIISDGIGLMEVTKNEKGLSLLDFCGIADGEIAKIEDFSFKANYVVEKGLLLIDKLLKKRNMNINDISLIIPQNTNISGWNIYCQKLGISLTKIFKENFGGIGHLGDVDMIRNIADIKNKKILKQGDIAMIYALGTGTSWNALLLEQK